MLRYLVSFLLFTCFYTQLAIAELSSCKDIFFKGDQTIVAGYRHEKSLIDSTLKKQQAYRESDITHRGIPYSYAELLSRTLPEFDLVDSLHEVEANYGAVPSRRFFNFNFVPRRSHHPKISFGYGELLSPKDILNSPTSRYFSKIFEYEYRLDAETWNIQRFPQNPFGNVTYKNAQTASSPREFVISNRKEMTRGIPLVSLSVISRERIYWPEVHTQKYSEGKPVNAYLRFLGDYRPLFLASTSIGVPVLTTMRFAASIYYDTIRYGQIRPLDWGPEIDAIDRINRSADKILLALGDYDGGHTIVFPLFKPIDVMNGDQLSHAEVLRLHLQLDRLIPDTELVNPTSTAVLWRRLRDSVLIGRINEKESYILFYNNGKSIPFWGKTLKLADFSKAHDDILLKRKNYYHAFLIRHLSARDMTAYILELSKSSLASDFFEILYILQTAHLAPPLYEKTFPRPTHLGYEARTSEAASIVPVGWQNPKSLQVHFKKHGAGEMFLDQESDYLSAAMDFFKDDKSPHQILAQRKSGSYFKYNFQTKEFGVLNANKEIVTYYIIDQQRHSIHDYLGDNLLYR